MFVRILKGVFRLFWSLFLRRFKIRRVSCVSHSSVHADKNRRRLKRVRLRDVLGLKHFFARFFAIPRSAQTSAIICE